MPITTLERLYTFTLITLLAWALLALFAGDAAPQSACSHFASPTGSGNACSQSQPCKVASWWPLAGPGKTLCLRSGTYRGAEQMITPPPGKRGTAQQPITVRAEHDGGVTLDANHEGFAVYLGWHDGPPASNDWFVVEGIDATNGREAIMQASSSDSVLKRVIVYNGTASQDNSFGINVTGYRSRAEDCAAWGSNIRKVFNGSQSGNLQGAGFRRCWGEWNDHPQGGSQPSNTFELGYNTTNQLYENVIGTWNSTGTTAEPESILHAFGSNDASKPHAMEGARVLGSIFYTGARFAPGSVVGAYGLSGMLLRDIVAVVTPAHTDVAPLWFGNYLCTNQKPCAGNRCENCLAVHAGTPVYNQSGSGWTLPQLRQGRTLEAATGGESAFTLLPGLCYRYEGGELTNTPLWPFPMDARIKKARVESGFTSLEVTAQVEALLGPIPTACRSGAGPEPPDPPEPPVRPSGTPLACTGILGEGGAVAVACVPQAQEGRR